MQIKNEAFHALFFETQQRILHFLNGCFWKAIELDVSDFFVNHVGCIYWKDRDFISGNSEVQKFAFAIDRYFHFGAEVAHEFLTHLIIFDAYPCNSLAIDLYNLVTG